MYETLDTQVQQARKYMPIIQEDESGQILPISEDNPLYKLIRWERVRMYQENPEMLYMAPKIVKKTAEVAVNIIERIVTGG